MNERLTDLRQRLLIPAASLLFFGTILYVFRAVLLPFIIALVIVYLMEPMVRRLTGMTLRARPIPRWAAVISVYISFFSMVTLFLVIFIPPLTVEVGKAAEEIPGYFNDLREKYLPKWSRQIEDLLGLKVDSGSDVSNLKEAVGEAQGRVALATERANQIQQIDQIPFVDRGGTRPLLLVGSDRFEELATVSPDVSLGMAALFGPSPSDFDRSRVAFTIVRDPEREGFAFLIGDSNIRIAPTDDGAYLVRFEPSGPAKDIEHFSLEKEILKGLSGVVESGSAVAGDLLLLIQMLLEFVINAFIMIILTFMVAAFISIDLPKIMAFARSLIPEGTGELYENLLARLNRGLSGVIRGQLVICFINGTLTGIGLWLLGVDFALMLGIIAGVLSLIPFFGTIISTVPAVLMGLTQGISSALLVLLWIMGVHFLDANFLTPKIVGSSSELHPVVIVFALLAGQSAFGVVGALLAMPVASIVQTLFMFILSHAQEKRNTAGPASPSTPPEPPELTLPAFPAPAVELEPSSE
ncbi:MAG: hypothetical protein AUK47_11570 [Deltaproteobacteria bacterium CG2_30_63_29]|nr:MAG: hypothetical protein AUK47_11570 [Deltaproteobacteria bacterium CG2_30_63_29]